MRLSKERTLYVVMQANKRTSLKLHRKLCVPDVFAVMNTVPIWEELQNGVTQFFLHDSVLQYLKKKTLVFNAEMEVKDATLSNLLCIWFCKTGIIFQLEDAQYSY